MILNGIERVYLSERRNLFILHKQEKGKYVREKFNLH